MSIVWRYEHVGDMLWAYRHTFERLKADENARVRMFWSSEPLDLAGYRKEFVKALHRRITRKVQAVATRKMSSDYETRSRRDKYRLRDISRRIRVYQFETEEVRRRFGHLLSDQTEH